LNPNEALLEGDEAEAAFAYKAEISGEFRCCSLAFARPTQAKMYNIHMKLLGMSICTSTMAVTNVKKTTHACHST
jgi:hypothetical protein